MQFPRKFILIGGIALSLCAAGQTPAKPAESANQTPGVAATQPVITVRGLCAHRDNDQANANGQTGCTKTMTREQFEALVKALNPDGQTLPPNGRQNLAKTYSEYVAIETAARNSGMEDTLQFSQLMEWLRLKTITDLYRRSIQEKFRTPAPEEITAYYKQHFPDYETLKLVRILIPRADSSVQVSNQEDFDKKAHEAANAARQRMMKGEDPEQIQNDAYSTLGLTHPPLTDLGSRRRTELVKEEAAELFSLKPGEVSQVETEPKSYVIYKVVGKDVTPQDQVKPDIAREIYQKKFKDAMQAVLDAAPAEFNEQYFRPATPATSTSPAH